MKRRSNFSILTDSAIRPLSGKITFITVLTICVFFLIIGRVSPTLSSQIRASIVDNIAPFISLIKNPAGEMSNVVKNFREMTNFRSNMNALKLENAQLLKWQAEALKLRNENEEMRALLNMVEAKPARYISAIIITASSGPYNESAIINAGSENGVKKTQGVVGEKGLIGYVIEVGKTTSNVLLLTDINARVAIIGEQSQSKAIVSGDGMGKLKLNYVKPNDKFIEGERIVTSGDGGFFPAGIPVAKIDEEINENISATPFSDILHQHFISVLDYSF